MKFAIGTVVAFESHGFDTSQFRKSIDGTQAIIHIEHGEILVTGVESNEDFTIYTSPSTELAELLASAVWSNEEEQI